MNTSRAYVNSGYAGSDLSSGLILGMENAYDGMLLADKAGRILYVNNAYQRLSGFTDNTLVGMRVKDLVRDGIYEQKSYPSAIDQRKVVHHIKVFDKTKKRVLIACKPMFGKDNEEIEYVVSSIRNIDELERMTKMLDTKDLIINNFESMLDNSSQAVFFDDDLASCSSLMKEIMNKVVKVSKFDVDILFEGETGTGKTALAKLLYKRSARYGKGNFIELNCGAVPHSLIESELFGYERGAFTGANNTGKKGLFEEANNGIIFLDEIEELGLDIQASLLSVLQERQVRRVGGTESKLLNFQVIAASNKPLDKMVKEGKFRQDLYYRLNVVPIKLPALRERREDVIFLANYYLEKYNKIYKTNKKISREVLDVFFNYDWPGNIRELANLVKSMVILSNDDIIRIGDLPARIQTENFPNKMALMNTSGISLDALLAELESEIICRSLQEHGSLRKAANALQMNPSSLYRRMIKYNVNIYGKPARNE